MRNRKSWLILFLIWLLLAVVLLPISVFAQELVSQEVLDEWFYSRLIWGALAGSLIGILAGLTHLCRLQFQVNVNSLNVNNQAHKKFAIWIVLLLIAGGGLLFLDAWLGYTFRSSSMTFGEAMAQVWLNYRMLLILLALLGTFTLMVALSTRLKPDCHCRYAFLPGPRGK